MTSKTKSGQTALTDAKRDLKALCSRLTQEYNLSPYSTTGKFINDFNADLIASLLKLEHFIETRGKK